MERRIYSSYSAFILRLHKEIETILGFSVTPAFSAVSEALGHVPADFASEIDILTDEPMGLAYQVWLETGRPLRFKPDCCSLLTYARFEDFLKPHLFGKLDDEDLEKIRVINERLSN